MSNEADIADREQEASLAEALYRASKAAPKLKYVGRCYYCDEFVPPPKDFCCEDCRKDWDEEQAIRKKQGLA